MPHVEPVPVASLRRRCEPSELDFETTGDLDRLDEVVGQERAISAIHFGVAIRRKGYNVFAIGPTGSGRHTVVRSFLEARAAEEPTPSDWCYVHDFDAAHRPRALRLPPGRATKLQEAMDRLVEELRAAIPAIFESDDYRASRAQLEKDLSERQEEALREIRDYAVAHDIGVGQGPMGFALAAMRDGEVLSPEDAEKLPEEERNQIKHEMEEVGSRIKDMMAKLPRWQKEHRKKVRDLDRQATLVAVAHLIDDIREHFGDLPDVLAHLDRVQADVVDHVRDFQRTSDASDEAAGGADHEPPPLRRYRVNVMVDHGDTTGAPVVFEDLPSVPNIIGRIEHISRFGALSTDFTLLKPGALHRANGGYLVLDIRKVLTEPYAWEALKRALRAEEIRTESLGQLLGLVSTVSLEPEPIPLDIRVVLIGERRLYYLLDRFDPELGEHFKVTADFDERMDRDRRRIVAFARLIATIARDKELGPLSKDAVARIVEEAARWAEDADKLSSNVRRLSDLLVEADHWASVAGHDVVRANDVQRALDSQTGRLDRVRDRVQEAIRKGEIRVETTGERVGQVNALSVLMLGDFRFGRPSRVTARVRLGRGEMVDIEREVDLGGPLHSKGVLILSGFLGGRFASDRPLSLSASLVFEQSYGGVDGDSASLAELCTLLSALSEIPIRQGIGITGSIDQHGHVQAIGGVNEKIEGFFDVCQQAGRLSGHAAEQHGAFGHGVIIPAANVQHLMLDQRVVDAVTVGKFHVWAVSTVDAAIELLTGESAGERDEHGKYPERSVNGRVEERLADLAASARAFGRSGDLR